MTHDELLVHLSSAVKESCRLDKELFEKFDVKRGLRNKDHTGVLVGLTNIGDVKGYNKTDKGLEPIEGKLFYRGMDVEEICKGFLKDRRQGFEESTYLLLSGKLPNKNELDAFNSLLASKRDLTSSFVKNMILSLRGRDIMNMLSRSVLALYTLDKYADDISRENILRQSISLIAKFPVIIAYAYHGMMHAYHRGELVVRHPNPLLSTAENFLYLLKGEDNWTKSEAQILDLALVLHAEHGGGNNSTFVMRVTSSSGTDTYASTASAIASLKGPLHGGANLMVEEMMTNIKANVKDWENDREVRDYLMKILRKEAFNGSGKIYGIGHAIYTLSDPRAIILKESARKLAQEKGKLAEYELYERVERLAPEAFAEFKGGASDKVVCANVDFYSGFVYSAIGIPEEVFTPVFAMSRMAGWAAHRLEELNFEQKRIIRPAYKNVYPATNYTQIDNRG
ncbi:MAG: citrate synthase [Bacteroidales bacterium]|nr:citrate synthase [Bacteroidales bacterium]